MVYVMQCKPSTKFTVDSLLLQDGAVFTFGSGRYGQLGHNSFCDELRPRLVAELWGAKVAKIACGWYSIVL